MAQTMPDTSVWAHFCHRRPMHPSLSIYDLNGTHLHIKTSVSIGEKEKICTYGKRRVRRLGPFCHRRSTQPSRSLLNTNGTYIDNKTLVSITKRKKEKYLWPSELVCGWWDLRCTSNFTIRFYYI